jgi:PAS domain S-box-containing protein
MSDQRGLFDVLAGQLPVGIALFDRDMRYLFANDALVALDGIPLADRVGRRPSEVLPVLGEEIERHQRIVLATGEALHEVQLTGEVPLAPGTQGHWLCSFFPLRADGDGSISGVGATVVDVTDRVASADAARGERDLYEALLRAQSELGEAVVVLDGLRVVLANDAAAQLVGRPQAELEALESVLEVIAPDARRTVAGRLQGVAEGRTPAEPGFRTRILRPDGSELPVEAAGRRLAEADPRRMIVIARDITVQVAREQERERLLEVEQAARRSSDAAQARLRLLADASALLERSLEADEALAQLAEVLSGRLADSCAIEVVDEAGRLKLEGRAERAGRTLDADPGTAMEVLAAGQARILGDGTAIVPLVARGRAVGLLTLGWADRAHRPPRDTWTLIEAVAQRLALAIDSAQQYREREHIARTLQASLLADALPAIDGVELAAEYRPAALGTDVGGDLYDAFALGDGAWGLVIGDVRGKGAEAAAVTALARYTLRALAPRVASPGETLALLNEELLRQRGGEWFITAALLRLEPLAGGGARLVAASGGHPPPVVLRADGTAEVVAAKGTLLGVEPGARSADVELRLDPGDTLVLYTDGVTEAERDRPLEPAALAELLVPLAPEGPRAVAREVVRIAERATAGAPRDDLAVLVAAVGA